MTGARPGDAEAAAPRLPAVPVRANLFVDRCDAAPSLVGSRDRETGQVFFPAETLNPQTMREGTLERHEFAGTGRLVAWTVVARGLPGFA